MSTRDEIDACKYLYLRELTAGGDSRLRVVAEEAKAGQPHEDIEVSGKVIGGMRPVVSDETCKLFALEWPSYVAYCVRNESFTVEDESEKWDGRLFRLYSKSHFRDYVSRDTFATDEYPGPLQHWELVCLNHVIDVVSHAEPDVRQLKQG